MGGDGKTAGYREALPPLKPSAMLGDHSRHSTGTPGMPWESLSSMMQGLRLFPFLYTRLGCL